MAVGVTRDHHNLRRNLNLNGNYISNDGGDEGISISDTGLVTIGTETDANAKILSVYKDITETAAAIYYGQTLEIERSGIATTGSSSIVGLRFNATSTENTGGATNLFGIWGEATGEMDEDAGNMYVHGGRIIANGGTNGTGYAMGLKIEVAGSGTNYGLWINSQDNGRDLRIVSSADTGDYFQISTNALGSTIISTVDDGDSGDGVSADLTLSIDGYIDMNSVAGENITLDSGNDIILDANTGITKFYDAEDATEFASLTVVGGTGATTLATASEAADGHLTLDADGDIKLEPATGNSILLDGTIDIDAGVITGATSITSTTFVGALTGNASGTAATVTGAAQTNITSLGTLTALTVDDVAIDGKVITITGDTDDTFTITSGTHGATTIATVDDNAAVGHLNIEPDGHVEFDGCAVGFDLETPTYNASDTDVSFITGNKQFVTFDGGDIADLNLIFPETSGNFVLLLKQDGTGSRTVTNYKAWDLVNSDAADGSATVKFAGGSNPDLTDDANHVDIISIFWDADNQIAYGVASLDFQF